MAEATFDHHAATYDDIAESALGVALRERVHQVVGPLLAQDDHVIDLGCGSGIDAAWLAARVGSVTGVDVSAAMVEQATRRCQSFKNVTVLHGDVSAVPSAPAADLVLANFGVINCVGDLESFAPRLAALMQPGANAVLVTMARWCPIELGIGAAQRNRELLGRRRSQTSAGTTTPEPSYDGLTLRYASAADLATAFDEHFVLTHAESLGLVLPPFEQRRWVQDRARLRGVLAGLDRRLGPLGARAGLGDHHLTVLRRLP